MDIEFSPVEAYLIFIEDEFDIAIRANKTGGWVIRDMEGQVFRTFTFAQAFFLTFTILSDRLNMFEVFHYTSENLESYVSAIALFTAAKMEIDR
jgi:hypothetical protein